MKKDAHKAHYIEPQSKYTKGFFTDYKSISQGIENPYTPLFRTKVRKVGLNKWIT